MPSYSTRPSRAVSIAVSVALVAAWGYIRLYLAAGLVFPLTYTLPLLVCVWTRDRLMLWVMAGVFVIFHTAKLFWILPDGVLSEENLWASYAATLANIAVGATAVHLVVNLRERLERALADVREQAEELLAQAEELEQQNEELTTQAEELRVQGEELASQNEELQSQTEEIGALNDTLERREALLQALLETARLTGTEEQAFDHIARAAVDLFGAGTHVAIHEGAGDGLRLRTLTPSPTSEDGPELVSDRLALLAIEQGCTIGLEDTSLRPDLLPTNTSHRPAGAALSTPIRSADEVFGALSIHSADPRGWTTEEFRLVEWFADQCGRMVHGLRAQAARHEADRRRSEFLATLSHELRNPLTPIRFALDVLDRGDGSSAEAMKVLRRQLRQLIRLVDDLLDVTRLSRNKMQIRRERINLVPLVAQTVDACCPDVDAAGHTLVTRLPDGPVWIDADADRMTQVLTNLLNNAIRYTPSGGIVTVSVSTHDGAASLTVADTGVGLSSTDADRVFEMFTQLGEPGSGGLGIGLSLVRGIVERHEGRVEVRSDGPGSGSEFRVLLPLATSPTEPAAPGDAPPTRTRRKQRVLVVDDNVDSADMIATLLELHGHEVQVAHDAGRALALAHEYGPDAALLDIGLPDITGYDLARQLRSDDRTRRMQLIALTGWGQENDRTRARAAGFDAHLTKPAEPNVLLATLEAGATASAAHATGQPAPPPLQAPPGQRLETSWPDAPHARDDD